MKITHKILNIPPYISTSWENIKLLALDGPNLVIVLQNESRVIIPNIEKNTLTAIFDAHAKSLEEKANRGKIDFSFGLPMPGGPLAGLETLPNAMQHNPAQANMPDLPEEVLSKISALSKVMNLNDPSALPAPEANCNCMYCQLARALRGLDKNKKTKELEEEVTEEDLKFRSWDIKQTADKQYIVSNPFNKDEKYTVFLGDPIGCTCGSDKCVHIQAVLKS